MRICDKCGGKNGVQPIRLVVAAVHMRDGQEKENRLQDQTIDLCGVCTQILREYGLHRAVHDLLNCGVGIAEWLTVNDSRFKTVKKKEGE